MGWLCDDGFELRASRLCAPLVAMVLIVCLCLTAMGCNEPATAAPALKFTIPADCLCTDCKCAALSAEEAGVSGDELTPPSLAAPVPSPVYESTGDTVSADPDQLAAGLPLFHRWQFGDRSFGKYDRGPTYEYKAVRCNGPGDCEYDWVEVPDPFTRQERATVSQAACSSGNCGPQASQRPSRNVRPFRRLWRR